MKAASRSPNFLMISSVVTPEGGVGSRNDHRPLVRGRQHPGDIDHIVGFEAEVELLDDGLGKQLDQRRRVRQG